MYNLENVLNYGGYMSKIKITNLKAGACVINSLKSVVAGYASIVKDASDLGDSDLVELESLGIISIEEIGVEKATTKEKSPIKNSDIEKSAKVSQATSKQNKKVDKQSTQAEKKNNVKTVLVSKKRLGTDFREVDNSDDQMGNKVVVMGENGPEEKHMNPGINGGNGPKYAGDGSFEQTDEADFITV